MGVVMAGKFVNPFQALTAILSVGACHAPLGTVYAILNLENE